MNNFLHIADPDCQKEEKKKYFSRMSVQLFQVIGERKKGMQIFFLRVACLPFWLTLISEFGKDEN